MIRHIFKTIWNERRQNGWIVLEYILIFIVLWFCCDFLTFIGTRYFEKSGYDMRHVYSIKMGQKPAEEGVETVAETADGRFAYTMTLVDRLERYHGVEAVSLSEASIPYGGWSRQGGFLVDGDTTNTQMKLRYVNPGFFEVFKIDIVSGSIPPWPDPGSLKTVIVSPERSGNLGGRPVTETRIIKETWGDNPPEFRVTGTTGILKANYQEWLLPNIIFPLPQSRTQPTGDIEITIRVSPGADRDFAERFSTEMKEQLNIGPYYFASITSLSEMKKLYSNIFGLQSNINGVIAITVFLLVNIFLGIMGTFWFRTQSRRSEIGLRMALGSSKKGVMSHMITETLLLLTLSVVVGTIICANIANTNIIEIIGMPGVYYEDGEISVWARGIRNFLVSIAFLGLISIVGVWYPARKASDTQPAEALHEE